MEYPGETEINEYWYYYLRESYRYSKSLIYLIDESREIDSDILRNNKSLEKIIELKLKYNMPILILLTQVDIYLEIVKRNENDWKNICKKKINNNKNILLSYINELIIKNKSNFKFSENDIMHISLIGYQQFTDEEIIKEFDVRILYEYNNADEENKKMIIKYFNNGLKGGMSEFIKLKTEMNILNKRELIEKIKEIIPSKYHHALSA